MRKLTVTMLLAACVALAQPPVPHWSVVSENLLVDLDQGLKGFVYADGQSYLLVSGKNLGCMVSLRSDMKVVRFAVIEKFGKKQRVLKGFSDIGYMKRHLPDSPVTALKYDANGQLVRDDNPPIGQFEKRCLGFIDGLPEEIRADVQIAFR